MSCGVANMEAGTAAQVFDKAELTLRWHFTMLSLLFLQFVLVIRRKGGHIPQDQRVYCHIIVDGRSWWAGGGDEERLRRACVIPGGQRAAGRIANLISRPRYGQYQEATD